MWYFVGAFVALVSSLTVWKPVARFKLAAFFYAQRRPVTLLRGSESRHQIA
jgi:hypothetical protein